MAESKRYYRVKKDTFMWREGAILESFSEKGLEGGYTAINDVWDACDLKGEYISKRIIESPENADTFERVYAVSKLGKVFFAVKAKAMAAISADYNE